MINKIQKSVICALLFGLWGAVGSEGAEERSLIYRFYNEETGAITKKIYIDIHKLPNKQTKYVQRSESGDHIILDEFILDDKHMTSFWKRTRADENTDYSGEKTGKTLYIKGKLKGESIDKKIALDDKPFYDRPEFNLAGFVLSAKKNIYFWMLRKDRLSKILMQAQKRGKATLLVNGKEMDVIRVYFAPAGMREKYHQQMYYFRKSDGLFVSKASMQGESADLMSEK